MAIRNITSAQIVVEYGKQKGVSIADLLEGSGLLETQLDNHEMQIKDEQELKILSNLLPHIQDPFQAGIELGSRYFLTSYGIMGYALLSSSTMRKATEIGLRYLGLTYAFSDIFLTSDDQDSALGFNCDIQGDLGRMVLMRDIWAVSVIYRELFDGNNFSIQLTLKGPKPNRIVLEALEKQLGGSIQFNAPANAYVGLGKILDLPLAKANEASVKICEQQCSQLLQDKHNWKPVAKLVRDSLVQFGLHGSMEDIAKQLARTTRTLHRQLKEEGTSWRHVRDDVRIGIAEELLLKPIQLSEIAERLGFSDSANFSHSFKRCKGITPSNYRKRHTQIYP
ncbi:MAG TPA: AraC family transcriptional regulator [Oceanospirillales bacterium]|nr:AraC family transcriptional regulator [Oleispira sp.]HCM05820.1 AraC family transcriptional regulator [Oceanospirillales bacterium]|tara:strand:+ start:5867 stop:6877 length:1011 start_codon:yes stop_codon:yes gene_type:complete